jgi:hypothetical protein
MTVFLPAAPPQSVQREALFKSLFRCTSILASKCHSEWILRRNSVQKTMRFVAAYFFPVAVPVAQNALFVAAFLEGKTCNGFRETRNRFPKDSVRCRFVASLTLETCNETGIGRHTSPPRAQERMSPRHEQRAVVHGFYQRPRGLRAGAQTLRVAYTPTKLTKFTELPPPRQAQNRSQRQARLRIIWKRLHAFHMLPC